MTHTKAVAVALDLIRAEWEGSPVGQVPDLSDDETTELIMYLATWAGRRWYALAESRDVPVSELLRVVGGQ
jgi:hypothetical protein